jgi:hypothetical protein
MRRQVAQPGSQGRERSHRSAPYAVRPIGRRRHSLTPPCCEHVPCRSRENDSELSWLAADASLAARTDTSVGATGGGACEGQPAPRATRD